MNEQRQENSYFITCASCGKETLRVNEVYSTIPKFGRVVMVSMLCSNCGYRIFDEVPLEYNGPSRVEFRVVSKKDLNARVIRSSTSRLIIPELGLELKPGARSESFITNVEGVLDRFLAIAEQLLHGADMEDGGNASEALLKIKTAMEGKIPFTIIIEDEYGNSGIVTEEESTRPSAKPAEPGL